MPSLSAYRLTSVSLTLDVGYLFMAAPAKRSRCSLPWTWDRFSQPPPLTSDMGYHFTAPRSQKTPGVTGKFGPGLQNEAGQRLIEFYQENTLVIVNTLFQQHKRRLYTWISPNGQHRNQTVYILCSQRWRSSIQSAKQDKELIVAQIMNSLLPNSDLN